MICKQCLKEFKPVSSGNANKFCSRECYWESKKGKQMKRKGEFINCMVCNIQFYIYPNLVKNRKFCSFSCYAFYKKHDEKSLIHLGIIRKKVKNRFFKKGMVLPFDVWNKGKPNYDIRGENNPNWGGGKTGKRKKEMGRIEYILWRTAVFMRDDYTCQECGVRGGKLEADHIKPWALYPQLRFAIDNGRTLCYGCHRQTDTWGSRTSKLLRSGGLD